MIPLQWVAKTLTVQVGVLHGHGCLLPTTMRCTRSGRQEAFSALAVVRHRPPPKLGSLPCCVFEPVFQQVRCALFVVGLSPVHRSSVCPSVSSIEVIAPDVALPYREPSFTAICSSLHLTRAYIGYRPCFLPARHLSRSLCLVRGTTSRLAPPLVLLPPLVHRQP